MSGIARLISPKAAAELEHQIAANHTQNLLTCKVWAHADGEGQIITTESPARRGSGVVLARIPRIGSLDAQRVLADNIAYALNLERGQL